MHEYILPLNDEINTITLGRTLASYCNKYFVLYLYGDIGIGKTTFTRGFLRGLGYMGYIISPTFIFIKSYPLIPQTVFHFDLYRIKNNKELEFIGIRDFFDNKNIYIIEWPEKGKDMLPNADIKLYLFYDNKKRYAHLNALSKYGKFLLTQLSSIYFK